jgi:hypothetical protein
VAALLIQESQEKSFSQMMSQSIEDGLGNVIGKTGSQAVMINFGLKDKAVDPEAFHKAMVNALREHSAKLLERSIIIECYRKLGERYDPPSSFEFTREFNIVRDMFMKK